MIPQFRFHGARFIEVNAPCQFKTFILSSFLSLCCNWFVITHVFAQESHVAFDQKMGFVGRSYPVGAQLLYTAGGSILTWGDPLANDQKQRWKYGYVRAALNAASSVVVNRLGFEVQAFPVSILGVSAGYDWSLRSFRFGFVDCTTYDCFGRVDRAYLKAHAMAAAGGVIFVGTVKYEQLRHVGSNPSFFDDMTMMPLLSNQERVVIYNPTLLYAVNEKIKIGATSLLAHAIDSNSLSHLWGPLAAIKLDSQTQFMAGVGQNHSSNVHAALTLFAAFTYTLAPSFSLPDVLQSQGQSK